VYHSFLCCIVINSMRESTWKKESSQKVKTTDEGTKTTKETASKEAKSTSKDTKINSKTATTKEGKSTKETASESNPDAEVNQYFADMAPEDTFSQYFADKRFSIYYPKIFVKDAATKDKDITTFRSPDKKVSITVSAKPIGDTTYENYVKAIRKKYKNITLYEYGDKSLTGTMGDNGKGVGAYLYVAFEDGKIYDVEKTYPSKEAKKYMAADMDFVVWWE